MADVDATDVGILLGYVLTAFGCALVWPPLAFAVPGAVLLWAHVIRRPGGN